MAGVSGGRIETAALRRNLEDQLARLMTQLRELDECQGEMAPEEWDGIREETLGELKHFSASLEKMAAGDMTLVDQLSSLRLATQAAISEAFKTPEVIKMFAKQQPGQLRQRLAELDRDLKFQKVTPLQHRQQKTEVLVALQRLKEKLSPSEEAFLSRNMEDALGRLEALPAAPELTGADVLKVASEQVKK